MRHAPQVVGLSRATIYREAAAGRLVLLKARGATFLCMDSVRRYFAELPRAKIGGARDGA